MPKKSVIENFPTEVLVNIFRFISFSDRLAASLVCKNWLNATNQQELLESVLVNIYNAERQAKYQGNTTKCPKLRIFLQSRRGFMNYFFEEICFENEVECFLNKLAIDNHIKSLTLNRCLISSETLVSFLERATNLKSLELDMLPYDEHTWKAEDFLRLRNHPTNVVYFRWGDAFRFIPDDIFNAILPHMPKLEKLSLVLGHEGYHDPTFTNRIAITSKSSLIEKRCLKVKSFDRFFMERGGILKAIELDQYTIVQPYIEHLLTTNFPSMKLEELVLTNCMMNFDATQLNGFLRRQPNLKKLSLRSMPTNDDTMKVIATLEHLVNVTLQQKESAFAPRIKDSGFKYMKDLKNIKKMDISNFPEITDRGFSNGIMKMDVSKMQAFSIGEFSNISQSVFNDMITKMTDLTQLIVVCSVDYLNDRFMQLIFQYLVNLKVLALEHTHTVTEAGFGYKTSKSSAKTYRIDRLKHLHRAMFNQFNSMNDRCLEMISSDSLADINLANCPFITFEGIKKLIIQCPMLDSIQLLGNEQLPKKKIERFAKCHLKRLKRVYFKGDLEE